MKRQEESWKAISGFEGLYDVSDRGRVFSYYTNRILNPRKYQNGYHFVVLRKNNKPLNKKISRLVAEHFIPNPENYPEVHHQSEDKTDNRVENLQWVSAQYNTEFSKAKYCILYGPNNEMVKIFNISKFARNNGLCKEHLAKVARGEANSHKGYTKHPNTKVNRNCPFRLISPDGQVFSFESQQDAANYIGGNRGTINNLVKGRIKSYKGWRLYPLEGIFAFT